MPCEYSKICPIYVGEYANSPIVSKNFKKELCDKVAMLTIEESGFCPLADRIRDMQKILYKQN